MKFPLCEFEFFNSKDTKRPQILFSFTATQLFMFRKELEIKPASNIKSSEKRKLQQTLDAEMEGLKIPNKLSKAIFNTKDVNKATIYFDAETKDPVLFQFRDNKTVIPTLHTLWASVSPCSNELIGLPFIRTHAAVVDRLINGANLMIRGCHGPYMNGLRNGAIVAVIDYKRPKVAVAIGICKMDLEGLTDDNVPESGVAVEIYTAIGDKLSFLGRNMEDVLAEAGERENWADKTIAHEQSSKNEETVEDMAERINELSLDKENEITLNTEVKTDSLVDSSDEYQTDYEDGDTEVEEEEEEDDDDEEEAYVMTTEDIDEMFRRSIMYTLSQDTLELPISATQFMSSHILSNLPQVDPEVVNMKKTSWRKTTKFLKSMEKEGFLKLKGKDDKLTVTNTLPKSDPRIANFVPYRIKREVKITDKNEASTTDAKPLLVNTYFKPKNSAIMLFNSLGDDFDAYYTEQDLKRLVQKYVQLNPSIVSAENSKMIIPDSVLQLLKIKEPIMRADLFKCVKLNFDLYYSIYREGDENSEDILVRKRLVPKRGKLPEISILVENLKVGRKVATRICGVENFYVDVETFARSLKVKCSGSTVVLDGKEPKDPKIISVQGSHSETAAQILHKEWGVPLKVCGMEDKSRKRYKKKKKRH